MLNIIIFLLSMLNSLCKDSTSLARRIKSSAQSKWLTLRPSRLGAVVLSGSLSSSADKSLMNILNNSVSLFSSNFDVDGCRNFLYELYTSSRVTIHVLNAPYEVR